MLNHKPEMPKTLTREQIQSRKDKAVRFVRDVLGDSDRAEEIEEESLDSYAERRKIKLTNPQREKSRVIRELEDDMPKGETKAELLERIQELEQENQEMADQLDEVTDKLEGILHVVAPDEAGGDEDGDEGDDGDDDDEGEE